MSRRPPRLAEWIVRRLVGGRDADVVAGDLQETFDARGGGRLWYWRQALSCLAVRISLYRRMLPGVGTDFRRALRRVRQNPGYALTAMSCLALAIGVNATLFSFLDCLYFRKLPVPEPERIVHIGRADGFGFCTWREYYAIRGHLRSVQAAATMMFFDEIALGRNAYHINVLNVSTNYAEVLRLGTAAGRWFGKESERPGAEPAAVISHRLWKTRFNGNTAALGSWIQILGRPYRIAGVALPEFTGTRPPFRVDAWVPLLPFAVRVELIARLAPSATIESAAAEMSVVSAQLRAAYPKDEDLATPVKIIPAAGLVAIDG